MTIVSALVIVAVIFAATTCAVRSRSYKMEGHQPLLGDQYQRYDDDKSQSVVWDPPPPFIFTVTQLRSLLKLKLMCSHSFNNYFCIPQENIKRWLTIHFCKGKVKMYAAVFKSAALQRWPRRCLSGFRKVWKCVQIKWTWTTEVLVWCRRHQVALIPVRLLKRQISISKVCSSAFDVSLRRRSGVNNADSDKTFRM